MIRIESLCVSYLTDGDLAQPVLTEVDMTIETGQVVLITGGSGCGKTTLLRCINGLVPDFHASQVSGRVLIDGVPVADQETRDLARRVGMVFQDPRSEFFTFDVTSELAFCCENFQVPTPEIGPRIMEAARRVGITDLLDRRIAHLSSGEKQKLAIAATLTNRPDVLLFDEPSANLDTEGLLLLTRVIAHLKGSGMTVLVADHRLSYLTEVMDRCMVLEHGRLIADLTVVELREHDRMWFAEHGLRDLVVTVPQVGTMTTLPPHEAMVRVESAVFRYPFGPLVWEIDELRLPAGQVIGVTGANGSGKTTLLKLLVGLLHARGERIFLDARRWSARARRKHSALVTQDVDYQLMGVSVLQEMLIGHDERDRPRAEQLLERFDLLNLAERHPLTLSGGQKQRLAIALACMKNARVVGLDEPTSGLDARNMNLVAQALRSLADEGALVLVTTHDEAFAASCFDSTIVVADHSTRHHHLEPSACP